MLPLAEAAHGLAQLVDDAQRVFHDPRDQAVCPPGSFCRRSPMS